ncbi:Ig-like domain-containing protein [Pediococcus pentosaceus]|uniref:Ig-like domain-containing protein n=1 Tax=Pediococcus pentosaceus TaxID=1255 RepID=UPI0032EAEF1D
MYDDDNTISGTAEPGAHIDITVGGKTIASGKANSDGSFQFKITPQTAGTIIEVTQTVDGVESKGTDIVVQPTPVVVAPPTIDQPFTGDNTVSGSGIAGDTIIIYNDNHDPIGRGTVDANGKYIVDLEPGYTLYNGEVIYATQIDQQGRRSDEVSKRVQDQVASPVINPAKAGDRKVSGTGVYGDTIKLYNNDTGNLIGTTTVRADGTWSVSLPADLNLIDGEELSAIQIDTKGNQSKPTYRVVTGAVEAPQINQPTAGDRVVSGTGVAGDTVTAYFDDGSLIGSAIVNSDGTWTISVPSHAQLIEGTGIYAVQADQDGNQSSQTHTTVLPKAEVATPEITAPTEGDRTISGKGTAGDTVTVYFDDGTEIGSAVVSANGTWTVNVSSHSDLTAGEHIYAVQTDQDGNASDKANTTVLPKAEVATPEITTPTEGDRTISGKGTAGDTVTVHFSDGSVIGSAVVGADGTWTVNVPSHSSLNTGDDIYAVQTDQDGNESDQAHVTVKAREVASPTIKTPTEGDRTISGKGTAGDTVTVYFDDGTKIGSAVVDADGNWTVNVSSHEQLNANDHIYAVQTDQDGNTSDKTNSTVLPRPEVATPEITTPTAGDRTISSKGTAGDTITVHFDDGSVIGSAVVGADGTWTVNVPSHSSLNAGDDIYAVQTDQDGNESDKASTTVLPKEVAKPTIEAPTAGARTISGKGTAGDTVTVYYDDGTEIGSAVVDADGNWTVEVSDHTDLRGGDNIYAVQTDADGNHSDKANTTVIANEVPMPEITAPTAGSTVITGTGVAGDTVNVYFDDGTLIGSAVVGKDGTWTINVSSHTSLNGNDKIYAVQTDQAGNQSEKANTTVIPAEVPAPGINQPTAGATTITGIGVAGDTVTVYGNDGTEIGTVVVDNDGNWTVDVPDGVNLAAGDTISVVQNDNYGDQSEPVSTTVLPREVTPPTINAPKAGAKTITGTGEAGDTVTVMTEDGTEIGSAVVDSDGNWSVNVPDDMSLIEGDNIVAVQTDQNGNKSEYVPITVQPA